MSRFVFTTVLALSLLASSLVLAGPAVVAVDVAPDTEGARALQVLTLQALADQGVDTADPDALRVPLGADVARELATQAGAERLFVLHLAPLSSSVLASLEEVGLEDGRTLARASLMIQTPADSARALGRLALSVTGRRPIEEGQLVSTVTESEAQPYSKRPGEFLFGVSVLAGLGAADVEKVPGLYGLNLRFFYEMPHVNFGGTIGGAGSKDAGMFEATIRAHYLFSESDTSGYLGGGLGISFIGMDDHDLEYGAHGVVSAGVEAFRLHATRLTVGVDVYLPTYVLEGDDYGHYDSDTEQWVETEVKDAYVVVPTITIGLMF